MLLNNGSVIGQVSTIVEPEDFYRPEHRKIYRAITEVYSHGTPPDVLSVGQELRKAGEKVDRMYLFNLLDAEFTTARANYQAHSIKESSTLRKLIKLSREVIDSAQKGIRSSTEIIDEMQKTLDEIKQSEETSKKAAFGGFFGDDLTSEVDSMKSYVDRRTGFNNLDSNQFFSPGLYVIGATPSAGKTTFCWQLLEQLARRGEKCIYLSYEMSRLELFTKSLAREVFNRNPQTTLTAAGIRRGSQSVEMNQIVKEFAADTIDFSLIELQNETVDDLLNLLRPLCKNKVRAPVICLDYLQIMPTTRESPRLGIDDAVRKLKKFQRETNTTFIVISSFNRANYTQSASFESFKDSGNIEYTADVVWALQLNVIKENKGSAFNAEMRRKIEEAKKRQPRQINLRCLKNRQGTNYDCYFNYYSAHDCFEPCVPFNEFYSPPPEDEIEENDR